jgi:hypothetical protein
LARVSMESFGNWTISLPTPKALAARRELR